MSHEIEFQDGKAQMAWVGQVPWHGLGTKVDPDLTPDEMMTAAGVDWSVRKEPAFIELEGKRIDIGRSALVRDTDERVLDVVTNDWEPLQNAQAFEFFNEYIVAGDMEMHTAGSLKGGRIVWALAKTKESFSLFNGDTVESYLLFTNPHQFGKSIDVRFTNTRVVCNNTLTLSLNSASSNMARITHRNEFDAEAVKETMAISSRKLSDYKEMAEFLGSKRYDKENIVEYFQRVFPVLSSKEDGGKKVLSKNAGIALELLEQQPGFQYAPGTFWSAFNTATFMTNHVLGRSRDNRLQSLWYGANKNLNVSALKTAVEMAEAV